MRGHNLTDSAPNHQHPGRYTLEDGSCNKVPEFPLIVRILEDQRWGNRGVQLHPFKLSPERSKQVLYLYPLANYIQEIDLVANETREETFPNLNMPVYVSRRKTSRVREPKLLQVCKGCFNANSSGEGRGPPKGGVPCTTPRIGGSSAPAICSAILTLDAKEIST